MNEKKEAISLIYWKECEVTLLSFLKRSRYVYLFFILLFLIFLIIGIYTKDYVCIFLSGFFLGIIRRDFTFIRRFIKTWSFTKKIINWDLVEKIAKEQNNTNEVTSLDQNSAPRKSGK